MERLDWLTYDTFTPHIGKVFDVDAGDAVRLELVDAAAGEAPGGTSPDGQARKQFRLLFRGPGEVRLEQATYTFRNQDVGEFLLFIVPVAADASGVRYEAVFS